MSTLRFRKFSLLMYNNRFLFLKAKLVQNLNSFISFCCKRITCIRCTSLMHSTYPQLKICTEMQKPVVLIALASAAVIPIKCILKQFDQFYQLRRVKYFVYLNLIQRKFNTFNRTSIQKKKKMSAHDENSIAV